jgi:hypothetical protein
MKTKDVKDRIQMFFKKPAVFRRTTSMSLEEFELLATKLKPSWERSEYKRLQRPDRKRKVGQGRPYVFGSFRNILFVTILYLRTSIGISLLAWLLGVDEDSVRRPVFRILPLLQDRFVPKTAITKGKRRINDLDELLKVYPELKELVVDGTEFPIQRPKKRQKQSYSGKKKRHTKKTQLVMDRKTKLFLGASPPKKGRIHDKKQLEKAGWDKKIPPEIPQYGDLGYLGMDKVSQGTWIIPHKSSKKKKLTKRQKRENKNISRKRIVIEHGIRRIKIFRRVGEVIKERSKESFSLSILASMNLANYKQIMRHGLG